MLGSAMPLEPAQAPAGEIERIFRDHHGMVYRAAYRITGNPSDAEDVLQTVFLRLLRRDTAAEAVENVPSYLHRAAVNSALDLMRSRQTARSVPLDDVAPSLHENASLAPDRAHSSAEAREWLRHAVARLSPQAAEIFTLRFFEGKENAEIAEIVGTTLGTVAVTLSRSRDRIEKEFRAYQGEKS
jgi:RNA polymerase sigma-70 factor (ECF subfamily)